MDKNTLIRTGVAGAVAAAGLVVGGTALASADDQPPSTSAAQPAERGPGGPGMAVRDTAAFATALDVSEGDLKAALTAVHDDLKGDKPAAGERPDREVRQAALATALAKELNISSDTVTAALEDLRADAKADRRTKLTQRLDAAVADDDLTDADKASVLKAFDAGVLAGGPR